MTTTGKKSQYEPLGPTESFIVPLLRKEIDKLLDEQVFSKNQKGSVLDVGCGNQPFRKVFEDQQWDYKSLDIAQNDYSNVNYVQPLDAPADINEKFDFLFCTEVLEHVLDWKMAFENFDKFLKKGGMLLITTPFFFPLHEEPYDYWRPTIHTIKAYSDRYNMKIIQDKRAGEFWDVFGTMIATAYLKPSNASFSTKLLYMLFYRAQKLLSKYLNNGKIQESILAESSLYLSNVFLIKKD